MKRRELLLASAAAAALAATRVSGQGPAPRIIGWLSPVGAEGGKAVLEVFLAKLKELGHVEGRDYRIEARWAGGSVAQLAPLAKELVAMKPAVIVTGGTAAVAALKNETNAVPIVFTTGGDPVQSGFASSLARPGGNITGVTLRMGVNFKLLELVRDTLPGVRRIGFLTHEIDPIAARVIENYLGGAKTLRMELSIVGVKQAEEIERAMAQAVKNKMQAIVVPTLSLFYQYMGRIAALALAARMPLFSAIDDSARMGGLVSYASDLAENFRRGAVLVDKILRGAKPGDLAIEQPDRYMLVVNQQTAKAIGVKVPQTVLARADEVIE